MNGQKVTQQEVDKIIALRQTGHSLPEIRKAVQRGSSTVFKYIKNVNILPEFQKFWQDKRKVSIRRRLQQLEMAQKEAREIITDLTKREKILIAASLYWAEGTKKNDFCLSNTDPELIRTFVECLKELGVKSENLSISIRVFNDLDKEAASAFWCTVTGLPKESIKFISVLEGKKQGKLPHGMCRIRVQKGGYLLKLITEVKNCIVKELTLPS